MDNLQTERKLTEPMPTFATDEARYEAVARRDPGADGQFFYAVRTTGVYCRPSCAARLALRENVAFHLTPESAEQAGFRACKRCRPREPSQLDRHAALLEDLRGQLSSLDAPKSLAALAARAGISPTYLQRLFKKHMGMSPREYAAAHRLARIEDELRDGASVTAALYEAGYSSSSRFYEAGSGALGMAPAHLRRGGKGVAMRATVRACSLGRVLIAATPRGVCAITFGEDDDDLRSDLRARFSQATIAPADAALEALATRIVSMIDAVRFGSELPLDLIGTAFQQRVWQALRKIPRGQTATYRQIAADIGAPRAVRAVGSACGKNPVAGLVPCHRVVRGDGELGGYRWGVARKRKLLDRESDV
jgi:AraC family transcriptional regulator, regulatory protein of adaptative response / methylated-DNA-[protein]-cysteine methyltransferase